MTRIQKRRGLAVKLWSRLVTIGQLFGHFIHRQRFLLAPLLIVLLAAAVLLFATGGMSYVAPFVYTLF